jgi:hypothetical protein
MRDPLPPSTSENNPNTNTTQPPRQPCKVVEMRRRSRPSDRTKDLELLHLGMDLFAEMLKGDDRRRVVHDGRRLGREDETRKLYVSSTV